MQRSNEIEVITTSLYDSLTLNNEKRGALFNTPVGVSGKTYADTNMALASMLPDNQKFLIEEIHFNCNYPLVFRFFIGSCTFVEFKLWGSNKIPILPIWMPSKISPIWLPSKQNFCWEVLSPVNISDVVHITMIGRLFRPVQ